MAIAKAPVSADSGAAEQVPQARLAAAIRVLAMDAVEQAQSGHPGMPMGAADIATVLFTQFLKFDPADPAWPDRDRFVLSAGHGSMLLYALLHLTGYPGMSMDDIKKFRQLGSVTAGHPEYGLAPGIETTTGPLGQGLATAVGMALAERLMAARFGDEVVDHCTYVLASDGDLMEGVSHEAASLAGHLGLGKLIVLYDDNEISIDGDTGLSLSDDACARFESYGWDARRVDGHDPVAIADALRAALETDTPSLIACRTEIAHGAPTKKGTAGSHGAPLGADEIAGVRNALGWESPPFEIPADIAAAWRAAGARGAPARADWTKRRDSLPRAKRVAFDSAIAGNLPEDWDLALAGFKQRMCEEKPGWATRKASGETLEELARLLPELIGGSADLTGSVNTKPKEARVVSRGDFAGTYIHYGVREHAMAAAMNGMALHGGLIPYAGTFMVFSDYLRPALRLAALMEQRVIHVLTHDSIGLGEDGPTHQPIEHLASLRAMPNLHVFRPADAVEVAECWTLALARKDGPSALSLTRQGVPAQRTSYQIDNLSARGAYVLAEASGPAKVRLFASGSEIAIARDAQDQLEQAGIPTAVISMPCWELFDAAPEDYRAAVLGADNCLRIGIEAATGFGWERYLGRDGIFIGMDGFGASAPAKQLYEKFGLTAERVVAAAKAALGG